MSEGISSSFRGVRVVDGVMRSLAGVDAVPERWPSTGSGEKRVPMRELRGYLSSKMSQVSTVSAVAGCGGICRKSREDSCGVAVPGRCAALTPPSSLRGTMGDRLWEPGSVRWSAQS